MDYQILVNKENILDRTYMPSDLLEIKPKVSGSIDPNRKILLDKKTLENWNNLVSDAKEKGYEFYISSAYRSYDYQDKVLKYYIEKEGVEKALTRVALPGASEHQTGLALDYFFVRDDIYHYDILEHDLEYIWMKNNAYKYGFIIRYPKGKENITGFRYEPWHLRYVGSIATFIHENNIVLEEYVNIKEKTKTLQLTK